MLSLETGKPIAVVSGGPSDGAVLGITSREDPKGLAPEVEFKQGKLLPLLDLKQRTTTFVAGPSGSGKSTYIAGLLDRFIKLRPKARILMFSRSDVNDDPAYETVSTKIEQVPLTQELVETPVDVTQLEPGTLLLYDDTGSIVDDEIREAVQKSVTDALEVGRKFNIHVIVSSHLVLPAPRKYAQILAIESQNIVLFPGSGSMQQASGLLRNHLGLGSKEAARLLALRSRWVSVHAHAPRYVIYDHGAYLL